MIAILLIVQVVTVIVIIVVLRVVFYRHLNSAIVRLKGLHEKNRADQDQLKEELERAKSERLAEVEKGKQEADKIIKESKLAGDILKRHIEEESRQMVEKEIEKNKEEVIAQKKQYLDEIEIYATTLAMGVVKHTLSGNIRKYIHHKLIEEICEEIEKIEKDKFSVNKNVVNLISSEPLSQEEKDKISGILSSKLDTAITIKENVEPEIIGGLIVEIGAFVIDGSLKNRVAKVFPIVKKENPIRS